MRRRIRQEQYDAALEILAYLPAVANVLDGPDPTSAEARRAKKAFKKGVRTAIDAAKQGDRYFQDAASGPGQRAMHETGFAQRAAVARLAFNQGFMKSLAESAASEIEDAARFLGAQQ